MFIKSRKLILTQISVTFHSSSLSMDHLPKQLPLKFRTFFYSEFGKEEYENGFNIE